MSGWKDAAAYPSPFISLHRFSSAQASSSSPHVVGPNAFQWQHLMTGLRWKTSSCTTHTCRLIWTLKQRVLQAFFLLLMRRVLWHLWEAGASITEDDNDCSFFTGIISQEQQQLYDDASIVNEASSINEHTIADDLGQPCHRWGICNFNLQQDGWKQLFSAAAPS